MRINKSSTSKAKRKRQRKTLTKISQKRSIVKMRMKNWSTSSTSNSNIFQKAILNISTNKDNRSTHLTFWNQKEKTFRFLSMEELAHVMDELDSCVSLSFQVVAFLNFRSKCSKNVRLALEFTLSFFLPKLRISTVFLMELNGFNKMEANFQCSERSFW